jgi:D-threo-aldose 1-dehydrogenase
MIDFPMTGDALCDRLAFGTGRLFKSDLANGEATLRRAYDLGIRHFDSSIAYGAGAGQVMLARLIGQVPADDLFVSTKIGYFRDGFPGARELYGDRGALWAMIHECYRVLRGKIDLLQVHEADLTYWWGDTTVHERLRYVSPVSECIPGSAPVADVLQEAKERGVCSAVGVTGNSARPLAEVVRRVPVDSVMCAYNLDPIYRGTLEHVAPAARERGAAVLAAGVLQGGEYRSLEAMSPRIKGKRGIPEKMTAFAKIQAESGIDAVELLYRWSLSVDGVDRWIFGASSPDQVDRTMDALRKGPLPDDLQSALNALAIPGIENLADE